VDAVSANDVWAVGQTLTGTGSDQPLVEHWDGSSELVLHTVNGKWKLATVPEPGSGSNIPSGLTNIDGHLWLAGMYHDGNQEMPLVENR
jgi:hypothetical protein